MKAKPKYTIGDWVVVHATVTFRYDDAGNRQPERDTSQEPFSAQIVGAAYRQLGTSVSGHDFGNPATGDCDYDPPYLKPGKTVTVWLVRRGITNKALKVLPDDLRPTSNDEIKIKGPTNRTLPWRFVQYMPWPDTARQEARDAAMAAPRVNGRFAKCTTGDVPS